MYNILIVDDEQLVLDGVRFILEKNLGERIRKIYTASTGRKAIEIYDDFHPDIVLMDIQMPGLNGLEAIRSIRSVNERCKCVIISAYEQFEYAKQAVELGVRDYILKPIKKQILTDVIEKIMAELEEEKKARDRELENQEKLDRVLPVLESGFIYSILMNGDYQKELEAYHALFDIKKEFAYMMTLEISEKNDNLDNRIGLSVKGMHVYERIRHTIKYKCRCIVSPLMVNRIIILIYTDSIEEEYIQRSNAIELAESIQKSIEMITGTEVRIGIGSNQKISRIAQSYTESLKALQKMKSVTLLHIKDSRSETEGHSYSYGALQDDETRLLRAIEDGRIQDVDQLLKRIFAKLHKEAGQVSESLLNIAAEMVVLIYRTAHNNQIELTERAQADYMNDIYSIKHFYDLQHYVTQLAKQVTEQIRDDINNRVSRVIGQSINYIKDNYEKDLRLQDVSEAIGISPQYFSRIFKEETGINFVDYLTDIRIDKAKELIRSGKSSIKEVCFAIGYKDPNYFSRLFKKVTGVSPSEF